MIYFTHEDHQVLQFENARMSENSGDLKQVHEKLLELHRTLNRYLRDHNRDLFPRRNAILYGQTACSLKDVEAVAFPYSRSNEQALVVERLMGKDTLPRDAEMDVNSHPVVELRLTPQHFVVELVLAPDAWWDQQNLVGKLSLPHHREKFSLMLSQMPGDFVVGFWQGCDLSDMHLTTQQLIRTRSLYDWVGTFADGQDWLRVGTWYTVEDERLATDRIVDELSGRINALYNLYGFLLWTSNNNFHSFYQQIRQTGIPNRLS